MKAVQDTRRYAGRETVLVDEQEERPVTCGERGRRSAEDNPARLIYLRLPRDRRFTWTQLNTSTGLRECSMNKWTVKSTDTRERATLSALERVTAKHKGGGGGQMASLLSSSSSSSSSSTRLQKWWHS